MKRILFVDDERNILDGVRRLLYTQRRRWDMHFVLSGEEALAACDIKPFDVIISDMRMPGMDGATLLGHIRDRFPQTARLILSGYSEVALATRAAPVAYRVLAKPCDGIELQTAIDRILTLQDIFGTPELRSIIGSIGELPSLSSTYNDLSHAMRDHNTSIQDVARILEKDIAMTAKVLQLVNSGFFGLAQAATSLHSAVSFLGMETIKNLALTTDTFTIYTPEPCIPPTFCEDMQHNARRTALIAAALPFGPKADPRTREIAVIACLLHDIGTLVLATKMPEQFAAVLALMRARNCTQADAELQLLGATHAEIGAYLLGLWGINSLTVEAVAHHHQPTRIHHIGLDASAAVYLADLLADQLELNPEDHEGNLLSEIDREALTTLDLLAQYPALRARAAEALR